MTDIHGTDRGFAGRVAVVTGAAGGIGCVIAHRLAEAGAVVAAVDRDEPALRAVADRLGHAGLPVHAVPTDVTDRSDVDSTVERIEREIGPIGFLVNVAGVLRVGAAVECTERDWAETFAVNTTGVFHLCRAVAAAMIPRRAGAIVTVASNAALVPRMHMAAYGASKAAASYLTRTLGLELAEHGIRCNVVHPGSTDTPMLHLLWSAGGRPETTIGGDPAAYRVGIPLRKLGNATDIAESVLFLLSDAAGHVTMHELTVDGGAALGA